MATAKAWALSSLLAAVVVGALVAVVPAITTAGTAASVEIVTPTIVPLRPWTAATANLEPVQGTVDLDGKPVAGVRVRVDNYTIPQPTGQQGKFTYLVDDTLLDRHVVTIADASNARTSNGPLTSSERTALAAATGAITVAYPVTDLKLTHDSSGNPVITGRIADTAGRAPPRVALESYALRGTVTDSDGKAVVGATVSTRTLDRDSWTVSTATDARGRFTSSFSASDETGDNPVPFTVRITVGNDIYQFLPNEYVYFRRLESATLNLQLPPQGFPMALPLAASFPGATYIGTVVGASSGGAVIRPLKTTWVDTNGDFSMTLPKTLSGKTVSLWEGTVDLFATKPPVPAGPVDLRSWPSALLPNDARDILRVPLKR